MQLSTKRLTNLAVAITIALALAACGDDDGDDGYEDGGTGEIDADLTPGAVAVDCESATPATTIAIADFSFTPTAVSVSVGDVVRWDNTGAAPHTVTSGAPEATDAGDDFDSGSIIAGGSYCVRFDRVAEWLYFCEIHPQTMRDAAISVQ